jgi:AmmeMemoRadiSam system protein A
MGHTHYMTLSAAHRSQLLALARQAIEQGLAEFRWVAMPSMELPAPLVENRGSFVTLRIDKQIRGCCGTLAASRSVSEDVWRNAWAAAFADPRFSPLEPEEWADVHLHIAVLSPLERLDVGSEADLVSKLRPNVDGIVLSREDAHATFLPEVWEQIAEPAEFLRHLKQKAGWPATSWSPHIVVQRFTVESFGEANNESPRISNRA